MGRFRDSPFCTRGVANILERSRDAGFDACRVLGFVMLLNRRIAIVDENQFFAVLTSKRDEALAHLEAVIDKSGVDEFCNFLVSNIMPTILDEGKSEIHGNVAQLLISHMALVGAVDALLSHRDKNSD
jgi:hypothetical protein